MQTHEDRLDSGVHLQKSAIALILSQHFGTKNCPAYRPAKDGGTGCDRSDNLHHDCLCRIRSSFPGPRQAGERGALPPLCPRKAHRRLTRTASDQRPSGKPDPAGSSGNGQRPAALASRADIAGPDRRARQALPLEPRPSCPKAADRLAGRNGRSLSCKPPDEPDLPVACIPQPDAWRIDLDPAKPGVKRAVGIQRQRREVETGSPR